MTKNIGYRISLITPDNLEDAISTPIAHAISCPLNQVPINALDVEIIVYVPIP